MTASRDLISAGVLFAILCGCVNEVVLQDTVDPSANSIPASGRGLDAKGMLSALASNFMSRGFYGVTSNAAAGQGNSQVVSLNLTNLVVLVLLKALIFAAGSIGAGTWKGGLARTIDGDEKFLTDEEILLFLSYLTGEPGNNGCLRNIACQQPEYARKYAAAGDMLLKMTKMFNIEPDISYNYALQEIEQAATVGLGGGNCSMFVCNNTTNNNNIN